MSKPILLHNLTPKQIALMERAVTASGSLHMDRLSYPELVVYQELSKLGFADMKVTRRKKPSIFLTDLGQKVRAAGYLSKKPVVRLTQPQINAMRLVASSRLCHRTMPARAIDVVRRMVIRGWVVYEEGKDGEFWARLTTDGWNILKLLDL